MKKNILIVILILLIGILIKVYSVIDFQNLDNETKEEARIMEQISDKQKKSKQVEIFDLDIIEKEIKPYSDIWKVIHKGFYPESEYICFYRLQGWKYRRRE